MKEGNSQKQETNPAHVHYHYHYYYPPADETDPLREHRQRASISEVYTPQTRKSQRQSSRSKDFARTVTEGEQSISDDSFKKMTKSTFWQNEVDHFAANIRQKESRVLRNKHNSFASPQILRFEEDQFVISQKNNTLMDQSFGTRVSQQTEGLIARYQREIELYKREIARLRNIEEECVFLRGKCLEHYQNCQPQK